MNFQPYTGSRADAIESGLIRDVTDEAHDCGFKWHVALTKAVWDNVVEWSGKDSSNQVFQSPRVRLTDMLRVAAYVIRMTDPETSNMKFECARIPRDGVSMEAERIELAIVAHLGDEGRPVLTIYDPVIDVQEAA